MFILTLFVILISINFLKSTPLSYVTYQRKNGIVDLDSEPYNLPYLIDEKSLVNDIYWPQSSEDESSKINNSIAGTDRVKKIHSLSVTNSLDVLRQRVLLELARQKALQDQQQINANRRFLNNIGKRSNALLKIHLLPLFETKKNRNIDDIMTNNLEQNNLPIKNLLKRSPYWTDKNELGDQYDDDDELQKVDLFKKYLK